MKFTAAVAIVLSMAMHVTAAEAGYFTSAKPIWAEGLQLDKNLTAGLQAIFEKPESGPVVLRLTASTVYRAWLNGEFCGYGPARGPHRWFRVDEWDITGRLKPGKNVIAIEIAGYNTNTYYTIDQPSFVQAEITAGEDVIAATGADTPFTPFLDGQRIQKVERYSFQRPYAEAYRLRPGFDDWRTDPEAGINGAASNFSVQPSVKLLPRRVPMPDFGLCPARRVVAQGTFKLDDKKYDSMTKAKKDVKGFDEKEIVARPSAEMKRRPTVALTKVDKVDQVIGDSAAIEIKDCEFSIVDFGVNYTGFIGATVTCEKPTLLLMSFDEVLSDAGDVNFTRMGCANVITFDLGPGTYKLESFEPYTCRYMKLAVSGGDCTAGNVYIRRYANPDVEKAQFNAPDERLNKLFKAGVETYAQNALDIFMDCPSRERAGWLCDSFFTARVAKDLSGTTVVEQNFYENFLLPEKFANLPAGMLPMCYPADHNNGVFIPNWAMWFVVQLEEYLARSGDHATVDALKPKVLALIDYFKPFKNSDGLLEKLDSWVFVEWSKANDFVQDLNYPSNMLYAGMLSAAGRIYNMPELIKEADAVRDTIRKQSYDGTFFVDNALRKGDELEITKNHSEVCQYFAFFFDLATPESHPNLWRNLVEKFGPDRAKTGAFPDVHPANSFIGNMLRFEILSRYGKCRQILDESIGYLLYMADRTGTLWENTTPTASCNHGFASHVVHTLYRDILGVYQLDTLGKKVTLRFTDVSLPQCKGAIPTADGLLNVEWKKEGETITCKIIPPSGYAVETVNNSKYKLVVE